MTMTRWGRNYSSLTLTLIAFLVCGGRLVSAQTIARQDLSRLMLSIPLDDGQDTARDHQAIILDWYIDTSKPSVMEVGWNKLRETGKYWWYQDQKGPAKIQEAISPQWMTQFGNREFVTFIDAVGFERRQNMLTCWEPVGADSLRLVGNQCGPYDSGIGITSIRGIWVFPDSSLLLCTESRGGDADDVWGEWQFLKETTPCRFERFYNVAWDWERGDRAFVDLELIGFPYFRCTVVHQSLRPDSTRFGADSYLMRLESAESEVVDLWDLSQKHFSDEER